jgi:hypothetical protein
MSPVDQTSTDQTDQTSTDQYRDSQAEITNAEAEAVPAEEQRDPSEDAHILAQPTELAGTAADSIAAEFAMRDAIDALADANGAAAGADLESQSLPLDGE